MEKQYKTNKNMTAVEWLTEKLRIEFGFAFSNNILEQANEMFEQQIMNAYDNGIDEAYSRFNAGMNMSYWESKDAKQYYNKTFKNK